jgi:hypothetical protein
VNQKSFLFTWFICLRRARQAKPSLEELIESNHPVRFVIGRLDIELLINQKLWKLPFLISVSAFRENLLFSQP